MKPTDLVVRCYAEKVDNQWQAFCLDFSLAAQADTLVEARAKLESMIGEYVRDALFGEDKDFAEQMLFRRAPLRDWLKYHWYQFLNRIGGFHKELFTSLVPLVPSSPYRHA